MNNKSHPAYLRFSEEDLNVLEHDDNSYLLLDLIKSKNVRVLMTNGFSNFQMQTPIKKKHRSFVELCFCLPSYWDVKELKEKEFNWLFLWLKKVQEYIIKEKSWVGDGHTIRCAKEGESFSNSMKQNHLFICDPIMLEEEFRPFELESKQVYFLFLVPIFPDEMDYKQGKGTFLLKKRFLKHGITEKLDEFRQSALKNRWRLFK